MITPQTFANIRQHYAEGHSTPAQRYQQAATNAQQYPSLFTKAPTPDAIISAYTAELPLSGLLIGIKDTFDIQNDITTVGSRIPFPPATADAVAVQTLHQAGAIPFGRTNMSEFAFSGLGINPHYGTPANALDATRIPGGSTAGGAVGVALGLLDAALGTDTGGSLRIPAAFNGIVGFKPSQASISRLGCFPLSPSLDCVGVMARNVADCAQLWQVLSGHLSDYAEQPLQLIQAGDALLADADTLVIDAYQQAITKIAKAGININNKPIPVIETVLTINQRGGLVLPESAWVHRELLTQHHNIYDPLIAARITAGQTTPLVEYIDRLQQRPSLQADYATQTGAQTILIAPTVAILPPTLTAVQASEAAFTHYNRLVLRNTAIFNYLDAPAISIPFKAKNHELPIGIMLCARQGQDAFLLMAAQYIETILHHESW